MKGHGDAINGGINSQVVRLAEAPHGGEENFYQIQRFAFLRRKHCLFMIGRCHIHFEIRWLSDSHRVGFGKLESSPIYFCFLDYAKALDFVDHNKVWKILQKMGIPDHLTCLLRNLYAGQEATVRTRHGTTNWFQIGKRVRQVCTLLPCLFNLYAEYIMQNARLDEAQQESRLLGEISITSDMQMTPPLWQKVKKN